VSIPRLIYCTWKDATSLPETGCFVDSWRKHMPDYEIRIVTDAEIPSTRCTRNMLERGKPVTAAQYAIWLRMYETGGICLDLDVDAIRSFDGLLDNKCFLGIENDGGKLFWAACGVIGAVAGHPLIREALDYMDAFDYADPKVENELGPRMWTKLLAAKGWSRKDADALVGDVMLYHSERFYPYGWQTTFTPECVTKRTYAVHRWAYTWRKPVSVVIPCYNQAQYLPEAIESCLAQSCPPAEIIVVDDASTDDTSKVAKCYPVTLIRHRRNKGVAAARNTGVKAARGHYICCLDADDRLAPEYMRRLAEHADIVSCTLKLIGAQSGVWKAPTGRPTVSDMVRGNCLIAGSLFRREVWEKVGGYDENMRDGYEDWDFWTRAIAAWFRAWVVDLPLFEYRTYPGDRADTPCTHDHAKGMHAELVARLHAKWAALGIDISQRQSTRRGRPRSRTYKLGVDVVFGGVTYPRGARITSEQALAMKSAGLIKGANL
jgi:hypothetical protein